MKLLTLHKLAGLTGGTLLLASGLATAATGADQVFPAHELQLQQVQAYHTKDGFLPLKAQKVQAFRSQDNQAIVAQAVKPYQGKDSDGYRAQALKGSQGLYVLDQVSVRAKRLPMLDAMRTATQQQRAATALSVTTVHNPVITSAHQ